MTSKYTKIAEYLADRYLAVQQAKTAEEQEQTIWERMRPENPKRPGANWWAGLGLGSMGAGLELGVGKNGLTDSLQRGLEKRELKSNPFRRLADKDFQSSLKSDRYTKFLNQLLQEQTNITGGQKRVGELLTRFYGTQNIHDPNHLARVGSELKRLIDPENMKVRNQFDRVMNDPVRAKKLVTAFGQFTRGKNSPTRLLRLRRAGGFGRTAALFGAYLLPSAVNAGKHLVGQKEM